MSQTPASAAAIQAGPRRRMSSRLRSNLITYGIILAFFVLMSLLDVAGVLTNSLAGQLIPVCAYICMAVSLNLVVGISGELSLGHAGFMSVGAFTGVVAFSAIGSVLGGSGVLSYLLSLVVAAAVAGVAGFVIGVPVMRLRGDYLAIVTLAFGEIIKNILNNLYVGLDANGLHVSMTDAASLNMQGGSLIINGPQGAVGITQMSSFLAGIVLVLITVTVVLNIVNSRSGRAIMAVRDNRIAAESVGINVTKYRLMAFVVAAALAGAAGCFYAMGYNSIIPKKFDFNTSILVLVFVVLGGMGNIRGSIISAAVLTALPELLRALADWRMLIYAVVLILVMIVSNNPMLRAFVGKLRGRLRRPVKLGGEAAAEAGVATAAEGAPAGEAAMTDGAEADAGGMSGGEAAMPDEVVAAGESVPAAVPAKGGEGDES